MIRIIVCDDQDIVTEGLRVILNAYPDLEVVGVASNGQEALRLVEKLEPNIVLMDLKMPVMNGIQATKAIREEFPDVKVLALTTFDEDEWVLDAIRHGASGYILKDTPRAYLLDAIRQTMQGQTYIDPNVAGKLTNFVSQLNFPVSDMSIFDELTEREKEVLKLIGQGMTNAQIADELFISKGTASNYVSLILDKLELSDRTQAAILAIRHGLANMD